MCFGRIPSKSSLILGVGCYVYEDSRNRRHDQKRAITQSRNASNNTSNTEIVISTSRGAMIKPSSKVNQQQQDMTYLGLFTSFIGMTYQRSISK